MSKILTFLFGVISISLFSQNHRFVYEYSFRIDSLNRDEISKEIMNLDITKEGSSFYSYDKFVYDSLVNAEFKRSEAINSHYTDLSKIKMNPKVGFSVTKTYPDLKTTLHTSVNGDNFAIDDNKKISWTILPENKEIDGFKTQKATASFGGRKWIAWFTNDIQFQDGPYKFCGLPGLILNLEDEKGDHIFRFAGNKKLNNIPAPEKDSENKEVLITEQKFKQLWKEYQIDPIKGLRQIVANHGANISVTDASGKKLSNTEILRTREQAAREKLKKTNNFLELSLYK